MPSSTSRAITPNMTSHSLRRGSAAYFNASPKLEIQWISTRGAWHLESLTKAFVYIGTTTREDQSVAKVLAGYASPDLSAQTPTIEDLKQRLSLNEFGQLVTLRDELFRHVLGPPDARFNVAKDVVNITFAALLMHLESVLEASADGIANIRYRYELERDVSATNAHIGPSLSLATCYRWGTHLTESWRSANHAQIGGAVGGGDSVLASTLEIISDRLGRVEDALTNSSVAPIHAAQKDATSGSVLQSPPLVVAPVPAILLTLAGSFLNW
ncbi:hypothetical protein PC129_g5269 [Phytophthora cactorum]|uniref:Uncharacterized protein n=1 Tax=Phytophthora cactorum TaxID=29920 RepID=A0A329RAG0_9STRA|nr:hypothetical protein Pcac1_g27928 [Phytophthora cactorum]KAG2916800.1 hypothetical protein PC114_g7377 [Phytophthora cactorum]KAG2940663.1 hypothetical protein PC117_g10464 [Phytophthora cactorum]KAG3019968.1 hypothetical protein PC119_g10131 [Phytophthora cactorum]KAG3020520.1 hypothetical protein PC120_g9251 [Phytophthora cactorum]